MSDVQEMMEWAIDLLKKHPVTNYVGEAKSWGFAVELARLRVELEVAMQESLVKIGRELCPGNDETCPGHDHGDPCHYRDIPGSTAMGTG